MFSTDNEKVIDAASLIVRTSEIPKYVHKANLFIGLLFTNCELHAYSNCSVIEQTNKAFPTDC